MATMQNPVTTKSLCATEVTSIFSTDRKNVDILSSEFDTSTGEDSSSFRESSDCDGTDATDEDQSEAETDHNGIISGSENEVCTSHLGEVGSSSVKIKSGQKAMMRQTRFQNPQDVCYGLAGILKLFQS